MFQGKVITLFAASTALSSTPTLAFFLQRPPSKATPLLRDLDVLIQGKGKDEEVKSLMVEIAKSRKGDQRKSLPGSWELLFTTEKEVKFFKTSWPFAKVSSITQEIDPYQSCTVDNLISFEGGGEFAVSGSVSPADSNDEYDRVEFQFQEAIIRGWGREISVPPVGAGYFDTMYCDTEYRLSRDNRGDWSVFRRF